MKNQAEWELCAGIINDGAFGHEMRDNCSSCAPFWGIFPVCPTHKKMLTSKGYCKDCKKQYVMENKPSVRELLEK